MRIAFNQPAFIPWGGFFARLACSDRMVLLDETVLARGFSYVNRNRLKGPAGEIRVTIPLKKKGRGAQKIKELEIHKKEAWTRDFLLTLRYFYGKSLYFETVYETIRAVVELQDNGFLRLSRGLIQSLQSGLGIDHEVILQSNLAVTGKGTPLLVSLAKKAGADEAVLPYFSGKAVDAEFFKKERIRVWFLRYDPPQYPQFWGGFLKNLSALDLLFCCGPEGRQVVQKGTFLHEYR